MRVVLDTNIWISGLLLPKSMAGEVITKWREGLLTIVTSFPLLHELRRVLSYPKIIKRVGWDNEKIELYLSLLEFFTEIVAVDHVKIKVEADPNDSVILATLIASKAEWLVTGDKDLLGLAAKYKIINLADFYKHL